MTIRFFDDSPDAGHPDCICSRCGERIEGPDERTLTGAFEDDNEYAPPVRMWSEDGKREARFHPPPRTCFADALRENGLKTKADESRAVPIEIFGQTVSLSPMVVVGEDEE
jgi:hypothetical protein